MGTQITIEIEDLQKAGWTTKLEKEILFATDPDGFESPFDMEYLVISKDNWEFASYVADCFFADCNNWGSNIHKFKEAGLFNIPHILS